MRNPFRRKAKNMTTDQEQAFINEVLADAHAAASHLGIPVSPVLAQWANETGWGTSHAFRAGNNFAGVSGLTDQQAALGAHLLDGGPILAYGTRAEGLAGYIARWSDGVYTPTRERWNADGSAVGVAHAIEESPWAAGHYGGDGLRRLITDHDLTRYDHGAVPAPAPEPGEQPPCGALRPGPAPPGHTTAKIGDHGDDVREIQLRLDA